MNTARASLLSALAIALPSCSGVEPMWNHFLNEHVYEHPLPAPQSFRDGSIDYGLVRRILALPLVDQSGHGAPARLVSDALGDSIAKLRRFQVVRPRSDDASLKSDSGPIGSGKIPVSTIIELGRRYGVDAVLFGEISQFRPYTPPSLGIGASLIDVHTGKVLWSVTDFVDASDAQTSVSMRLWFEEKAATDDTVYDERLVSTSPRWFARFATDRLASTL